MGRLEGITADTPVKNKRGLGPGYILKCSYIFFFFFSFFLFLFFFSFPTILIQLFIKHWRFQQQFLGFFSFFLFFFSFFKVNNNTR